MNLTRPSVSSPSSGGSQVPANLTSAYEGLGPTATSVTITAPNGASMTLSAGSNISLVITAANGTQTCSVTGGPFPYAALIYNPVGPALVGCSSSACYLATYIWAAIAAAPTDGTGCFSYGSGGVGVGGNISSPYCLSTCSVVNFTSFGPNPAVYLSAGGTWYSAGTNQSAVVFAGFSSLSFAPPSPPPSPLPPTVAVIAASMALQGVSAAQFTGAVQSAFLSTLAGALGVPSYAIAITGVTDLSAPSGRRLTASGVNVAFTVAAASTQMAGNLNSALTAISSGSGTASFVSSLNANLASTGVSISGIAVAPSPPLAPPPSPPSPPAPPPAPISLASLTGNNTNVSAVTAQVTSNLASLSSNASALASAQASILTSLTSGLNTSTNLSSGNAAAAASLVLAVVSAAPNVTLSPSSQSAALSVLSAVASAPINVSGAAGVAVMSALSSIAGSASTNNPGALTQVTGVLDSLASNAASSLLTSLASGGAGSAAPASITFSTPNIQAAISVTPPGTVNTAPISAPGSPSSFNPMPPGLLSSAGSAAVITNFRSLAFDPYGNTNSSGNGTAPPASNLSTVGGVTRLAFSTANGTLEVANATTPITFTLPLVSAAPGSLVQGVCSFYDTVAQAYSTNGCIGVPNPGPPGHTLAFIPGYQTPNDTSLASSWTITGSLLAGCTSTIIDCNLPSPPVIYPNPKQPLAVPAVSCPANATKPPVLRVYYGAACQIWQPTNALNCSWDNIKQAFVGTGCVPTGNVTQCMCRHLTDFAAARAPVLTTCSLSDMLSLNPADIVTKLRILFIVVITLFGCMNLGAVVGAFLDAQEHRNSVLRLTKPATGFVLVPPHYASSRDTLLSEIPDEGVWTWTFEQAPLMSLVESPRGSGPTLALAMSMPYFRLRLAIPEELCASGSTLGEALGRQEGLSASFLNTSVDIHDQAFNVMMHRRAAALKIPSMGGSTRFENIVALPGKKAATNPSSMAFKVTRMAPTALVMAFMTITHALPLAELSRRKADAARFFHGVRAPGIDHDFHSLMRLFMGMLSEGNLSDKSYWLEKAQLWRLLLLQHSDGSFDVCQSLAIALQAHAPVDAADEEQHHKKKGEEESELDDVIGDEWEVGAPEGAIPAITDDPIVFSLGAIMEAMPRPLFELWYDGVDAQRVWATVLAQACMEEFDVSWLASDEEDRHERTAVDAADAWLREQAKLHPTLSELLRSGRLKASADSAREKWDDLMKKKVGAMRSSKVILRYRLTTHAQRAAATFVHSLMTEHDQFSTFLDTSSSTARWQRWMILMTLVAEALLISIWFYQSRSAQCCTEIRAILNCESPTSCLGFTGSCSDLQSQFATLQGPWVYGTPPSEHQYLTDYACHAFPDDAYPLDQLLVGLISFAVAIPVAMFLARCFEVANENDDEPEAWLEMPDGWVKYALKAAFGMKPHGDWHYTRAVQQPDLKPCQSGIVRWMVRRGDEMPTTTILRLLAWVWNSLCRCVRPEEEGGAGDEGEEEEEDESGGSLIKRLYALAGLVGVYLCWAIFSWFIFTYGMLIYRQMGDQAQKKFTQSWGVNFGVGSASEWQDVAQAAIQAAVIVVILDMLHITRDGSWFEQQVDFLSTQASLFSGAATSSLGRAYAIVKQQMRLT